MKFREYIQEKVYRHENPKDWAIDSDISTYLSRTGHTIIAIGLLKKFAKKQQDSTFVFVYLGKTERYMADEFKSENKNKNEILCRYVSSRSIVSNEMPLCILNVSKGYMRFMDNINDDPEIEDAKWSKPEKFDHLRTIL